MNGTTAAPIEGYEIRSADASRNKRFDTPEEAGRYFRCFLGDRTARVFVYRQGGGDRLENPAPAEVAPVFKAMEITAEQEAAIEESIANIAANSEAELLGARILEGGEEFSGFPENALIVEFTYCDVVNDTGIPGREVTVFAADGEILDSQDFG
jgi:hypothetical protein